jgi:glutamate--cysteine ligase catalytic subunit
LNRALGTPLQWDEAKKNADHVREWGIEVRDLRKFVEDIMRVYANQSQQLLAIWRRAKGKERDALLWGDEVRHFNFPLFSLPYWCSSDMWYDRSNTW